MTETLKPRRIIRVEFEMELPCAATHEEIDEWLHHQLGQGGVSTDNPLCSCGIELVGDATLTDTRNYLHDCAERKSKSEWTVRRWRETEPQVGRTANEQMRIDREQN